MKDAVVEAIVAGAFGEGNSRSEDGFRMPKAGYECRNEVMQLVRANCEVHDCSHFGTIQSRQSPL
jgi:hypothetical protein